MAEAGVDVNACSPGWIATKMGGAGGGPLAEEVDTPLWLLRLEVTRSWRVAWPSLWARSPVTALTTMTPLGAVSASA